MAFLVTPGQWGDAPHVIEVLDRIRVSRPLGGRPRTRPDHISGDKAYSSRRNRRYLRRRRIKHTIPEPRNQRANRRRRGSAGGRPAGFDRERYRRRNEVERTINRLKNSRAVATRYDSGPTSSMARLPQQRSAYGSDHDPKPLLRPCRATRSSPARIVPLRRSPSGGTAHPANMPAANYLLRQTGWGRLISNIHFRIIFLINPNIGLYARPTVGPST